MRIARELGIPMPWQRFSPADNVAESECEENVRKRTTERGTNGAICLLVERPVNILHVEDDTMDAAIVESALESAGIPCKIRRVQERQEFNLALADDRLDLIISDSSLPRFDGLSALVLAKQKRPEVPFIFVSGTIGEEAAIEALKEGAADYVLKDRLSRLPTAVKRALRDARDEAERRQVEEQLRKSEERFQLATRATQDVVWDWDIAGNSGWRNENFQNLFGYAPGELEPGSDAWRNRIHAQDRERVLAGVRAAIAGTAQTWSDEYRFLRADDSVAEVLDRGHIIRGEAGRAVRMLGAMMDITTRKSANERIREQAALLDKARDSICQYDMTGRVIYWNKSAEILYGWTAGEALGRDPNHLLVEGGVAESQEALRHLMRHSEWQGDLHHTARNGRKLVVESRWTLMRDDRGEGKSILVIDTDVTEKRRLEAEFLRSQREQTIGALAGGIAHDLNNALTPILMGVSVMREEPISVEGTKMLDVMDQSARRGADMVQQILSFARGVGGQRGAIKVAGLIEEIARLARKTFPRTIEIKTLIQDGVDAICGNMTQLHQVLLNLCVNARDAMPQGGQLTIEAGNVGLDPAKHSAAQGLPPGTYVLLSVSDTGQGIAQELLNKIFDPFFTTKEVGRGTGLGLSTVMGIVKTHGGFVEVDSRVGSGTSFKVFLPASARK
jgi:PAS domain S-box-containing protein